MNNIFVSENAERTATDILLFYINNANIESAYALLKEQEVNIEMKNNLGMTPLHQAVKVNHLKFVNLLLDFGADPNSRAEYSEGYETPLMLACTNNFFEIASLLLDFGADPTARNSQGIPCLHLASMNGCLEICLLLIARGFDPTIRDDFGNNASYWAYRNYHYDILKFLPPVATVSPPERKEFQDQVDEKYLGMSLDYKKKMMSKNKKKK